jgi:hypothetical protein
MMKKRNQIGKKAIVFGLLSGYFSRAEIELTLQIWQCH